MKNSEGFIKDVCDIQTEFMVKCLKLADKHSLDRNETIVRVAEAITLTANAGDFTKMKL